VEDKRLATGEENLIEAKFNCFVHKLLSVA
jgi:hypothetical protein